MRSLCVVAFVGLVACTAAPSPPTETVIASPDAVTVVVRGRDHVPSPSTLVVFHDADGAAIDVGFTDARGIAASDAPGVVGVTVIPSPENEAQRLSTVLGVALGDVVTFDPQTTRRDVVLPPAMDGTSIWTRTAHDSRDRLGPVLQLSVDDELEASTVFAVMRWPASGALLAYSAWFGEPAAPIALPPWRSDVDVVPVEVTGLAADIVDAVPEVYAVGPSGALVEIGFRTDTTPSSTSFALVRGLPPETPIVVELLAQSETSRWDHLFVALTDAERTDGVALEMETVPSIAALLDATTAHRPYVLWTSPVGLARASLVLTYAAGPRDCTWTIDAYRPGSDLTVPALPEEAASLRPATGDWWLELRPEGDASERLHPLGPFTMTRTLGAAVTFYGSF